MAPAGVAAHEEAAYYQSIEEFFVSRRGDPLVLSNADWLTVRKWRRAGLPLRVAMRGIADALDGHAHSWGRKRKVASLSYCAAEVDAAAERWRRALSFDAEAESSVPAAIASFAAAVERATGLGTRGRVAAPRVAAALREPVAAPERRQLEALTARLGRLEAELLEAVRADADPSLLAALGADIEAELAPYRGRMPARVLDQIQEEGWTRRLLAHHGIPRLSLFHL